MKIIVEKPMSLFEATQLLSPDSSKTTCRSWLKDNRVLVDDVVMTDGKELVFTGQTIRLGVRKPKSDTLDILFEDRDIVVVNKPAGLLSVSTNFEKSACVHGFLKERYSEKNKVYVVHRLDQDTSGVILFALNEKAYEFLKEELKQRLITREYLAIVEGKLEKKGAWECYLEEDASYRVHASTNPAHGEKAKTYYDVLANGKDFSVLRLHLETGKKNQIRVQASYFGHPVLGDGKYGSKTKFPHIALHARMLRFVHPRTKKVRSFTAAFPPSIEQFLLRHHVEIDD